MNGFVFIDKPEGFSSFQAVAKCRRIFDTKKIGHTGTLDPMATGVLVVAVGNSTRFIELIPSHDKAYEATFKLGIQTDTLDITGNVINEADVHCSKDDVLQVLKCFQGKINQLPPMYSAIKQDGKRLYELARQGINVERKEREIEIYSIEMTAGNEETNEYRIAVSCSSGTYIRTLIDDIGNKLGCYAVMTALRRTSANGADIKECYTFDDLEKLKENNKLEEILIPVDELLDYPKVTVSDPQGKRFNNGGELDLIRVRQIKENGMYRVYSQSGQFCGIGKADIEEKLLKVKRVYVNQ